MRTFIFKSAFFIVPFFILFIITKFLYSETEGPDLLRLGYIPNIYKDYRNNFPKKNEEKFIALSAAKEKKYKIMTIGDSFSEQGADGYKNYLAEDYSVLHIDRFISKNQIQTLIDLLNGDFFNNYEIEYVVLQVVERHLMDQIDNIKIDKKLDIFQLDSIINKNKPIKNNFKYEFFSKTTIKFPLYYLPKYFTTDNYISSEVVYNYDLNSKKLFSNNSNKLLFYHFDIKKTLQNNDIKNANKLSNILNHISKILEGRNIKLIFLPSPDKYDLYYNNIVNKKGLPKPIFFDNFKSFNKEYIYIDLKNIFSNFIDTKPDLYYYDDTHWSPIGSEIISNTIKDLITKNENGTN
jgi:hypothetical protein